MQQKTKTMKNYITLLLLALLVPAFSFAQDDDYENRKKRYMEDRKRFNEFVEQNKSSEEDAYYQNRHYKPFEPVNREVVSNYYDDFFKFMEVDDYTPYCDTLYNTPYQDSIHQLGWEYWASDSMIVQYVGKIDKYQILKQEKKGNVKAFVYNHWKFENRFFGEMGIWVAYSDDNGETWSYYYTGIVQKQPLYVKWYSSYSLINEQGDLQIEACLFRQMSNFMHPGPGPSYQLVKDGLLLTLDLETLRKDSDGDGLTDIVEAKFRTDPKNADTDGDGVPDNLDLNPRFALQRTEKTLVYEAVMNADGEELCNWDDEDCVVPFSQTLELHYATDNTQTILIVTDDPALQNIQPTSSRVIILTEEEYENNPRYFRNDLNNMKFTPFFKVDGKEDTYLFSYDFNTGGVKYWVKKTDKGWKIVKLLEWIS